MQAVWVPADWAVLVMKWQRPRDKCANPWLNWSFVHAVCLWAPYADLKYYFWTSVCLWGLSRKGWVERWSSGVFKVLFVFSFVCLLLYSVALVLQQCWVILQIVSYNRFFTVWYSRRLFKQYWKLIGDINDSSSLLIYLHYKNRSHYLFRILVTF